MNIIITTGLNYETRVPHGNARDPAQGRLGDGRAVKDFFQSITGYRIEAVQGERSGIDAKAVKRPKRPPGLHGRRSCTWYFPPQCGVDQCRRLAEIHHPNPRRIMRVSA
jgi:hypothetical protein